MISILMLKLLEVPLIYFGFSAPLSERLEQATLVYESDAQIFEANAVFPKRGKKSKSIVQSYSPFMLERV